MSRITWHDTGKRFFEAGVDRGVFYPQNSEGAYTGGVAWNGLISVTESPSGAEPNAQYADNRKYLNLRSAEEFSATVEAYTYPDEMADADGTAEVVPGVRLGQQPRKTFGLSYRTLVGNEIDQQKHAYKIHLVYGATAGVSEKAYNTINESPEASTFSWELTTDPISIEGFEPTATITIDSRTTDKTKLKALEDKIYGTAEEEPSLPSPEEVLTLLGYGAGAAGAQTTGASTMSGTFAPAQSGAYTVDHDELTDEDDPTAA